MGELMEASKDWQMRLAATSDIVQRQLIAKRAGHTFITDAGVVQRAMWDSLGYAEDIRPDDYWARYLRHDIAGAIVDAPVQTTWRDVPTVQEPDSDPENATQFEVAWGELAERLRIWHYFERVDRLAGVGNYAILLIGSSKLGGLDQLAEPLQTDTITNPEDIGFLSVFRQKHAEIEELETDPTEERFGLPKMYQIDFAGDRPQTTIPRPTVKQRVHWSRLLHVAEDLLEDEIYGRPRLERVWNLLTDLLKIGGGSAEMFWANVAGIWHLDIPADVNLDPDSLADLDEKAQESLHGLRRILQTRSADLELIGAATPDPSGVFEVLKSLVSATTRIPQRILFGSERGELASSQDMAEWLGRISERQDRFAEPQIIRPFVDRLMEVGALPAVEEYEIVWPDLFELNEQEQAQVMQSKATAWKQVSDALVAGAPIADSEVREDIFGLDPERPDQDEIDEQEAEEDAAMEEELEELRSMKDKFERQPVQQVPPQQQAPPQQKKAASR